MTAVDRALLDLAGAFYAEESGRVAAVHARFGMTPTRFWQRVNALIGSLEALEHDPLTVNRLRRLRASRVKSHSLR